MSGATRTLSWGHASAGLLLVALALTTAVVAGMAAWRGNDSEGRGSRSIALLEIGTQADSMLFDRTELTARAGATITVVFHNTSRLATIDHNWVLVQAGTEQAVAAAGAPAGPQNDYVDPNDANVIAFTKLTAPGERGRVTLTVPPPGNYPYLCTFPGHHLVMKGTLVVNP